MGDRERVTTQRNYPGGIPGRAALSGRELLTDLLTPLRFDAPTGIAEWVANEGACPICKELDGILVPAWTDVEEYAHPNCQCNLVPV